MCLSRGFWDGLRSGKAWAWPGWWAQRASSSGPRSFCGGGGAGGDTSAEEALGEERVLTSDDPALLHGYKALLAYDGTAYAGWQYQRPVSGHREVLTVQGEVERALSVITGEPRDRLGVQGASRTDAGVHARGQVAQFRSGRVLDSGRARASLNKLLPEDVRVLEVAPVPPDFSAISSSLFKEYTYSVLAGPVADPLGRRTALHFHWDIDVGRCCEAAALFPGEHDFAAFTNNPKQATVQTVRRLGACEIIKESLEGSASGRNLLRIRVEGKGFLFKMVRHMSAAILEVGAGRLEVADLQDALADGRAFLDAGRRGWRLAPAHGLCLEHVAYPPHGDPGAPMHSQPPQGRAYPAALHLRYASSSRLNRTRSGPWPCAPAAADAPQEPTT